MLQLVCIHGQLYIDFIVKLLKSTEFENHNFCHLHSCFLVVVKTMCSGKKKKKKPQGKLSSEDAAKLFSSQLVPVDTKNSTSLQEREGHHKG